MRTRTLNTIVNWALLLEMRGELVAAASLYREAMKGQRHTIGAGNPRTQYMAGRLAKLQSELEAGAALHPSAA